MILTDLTAGLQAFHATVTGVVRADPQPPRVVNSADLPLVATYAGPATWEYVGAEWVKLRRQMLVRCLVKPVAQGVPVADGYLAATTMLNNLAAAYWTDPTLGHIVNEIYAMSDSGITTLAGPTKSGSDTATEYWGFEVKLTLEQIVDRSTLTAVPLITQTTITLDGEANLDPPPV